MGTGGCSLSAVPRAAGTRAADPRGVGAGAGAETDSPRSPCPTAGWFSAVVYLRSCRLDVWGRSERGKLRFAPAAVKRRLR